MVREDVVDFILRWFGCRGRPGGRFEGWYVGGWRRLDDAVGDAALGINCMVLEQLLGLNNAWSACAQ